MLSHLSLELYPLPIFPNIDVRPKPLVYSNYCILPVFTSGIFERIQTQSIRNGWGTPKAVLELYHIISGGSGRKYSSIYFKYELALALYSNLHIIHHCLRFKSALWAKMPKLQYRARRTGFAQIILWYSY